TEFLRIGAGPEVAAVGRDVSASSHASPRSAELMARPGASRRQHGAWTPTPWSESRAVLRQAAIADNGLCRFPKEQSGFLSWTIRPGSSRWPERARRGSDWPVARILSFDPPISMARIIMNSEPGRTIQILSRPLLSAGPSVDQFHV